MKRLFFPIFSVLIFLSVSAQTTFVKSYDIYKSAFSDLVFAQDDGYLMAMVSLKVDKYYLSFIKTNLNGDTLWTKDYDRGITHLTDISGTEDEAGNLFISLNGTILKLDRNANITWSKRQWGYSRRFFVKNNIIWSCIDANGGSYIMKADADTGDSLWCSQIFNYEPQYITSSHATAIVTTDNGDVLVTVSQLNSYDQFPMQSKFFRLAANSTEITSFTIPYNKDYVVRESKSIGNDIVSIASNVGYIVNDNVCYFIRYSSDGTLESFKEQHFGYTTIGLHKCVIPSQNEVVAMGNASSGNVFNVMLHCFSMNGDSLWTQLIESKVIGADLKIAADDGFVITGALQVSNNYTPYLIKTTSMGTLNSINENRNTLQADICPNPSADFVIFNTTGITNGKLIISDSLGHLIAETSITSNKTTWDCSSAKEGVYFYRLVSNNKSGSGKIVVGR